MNTNGEEKMREWESEFDKRFTDSSIDFRYKGDRDVMKYEIKKILNASHLALLEQIIVENEGRRKATGKNTKDFIM